MRETYTRIYIHIVWATWNRLPILLPKWKQPVLACIQAEYVQMKAEVLALNAMTDHVHLLVSLPPPLAVAVLVKQVKGASSHLVTNRLTQGEWFKWQGAYSALSVSPSVLLDVRQYIVLQEQHHLESTYFAEWETTE